MIPSVLPFHALPTTTVQLKDFSSIQGYGKLGVSGVGVGVKYLRGGRRTTPETQLLLGIWKLFKITIGREKLKGKGNKCVH
jgi:hypothetical protein